MSIRLDGYGDEFVYPDYLPADGLPKCSLGCGTEAVVTLSMGCNAASGSGNFCDPCIRALKEMWADAYAAGPDVQCSGCYQDVTRPLGHVHLEPVLPRWKIKPERDETGVLCWVAHDPAGRRKWRCNLLPAVHAYASHRGHNDLIRATMRSRGEL